MECSSGFGHGARRLRNIKTFLPAPQAILAHGGGTAIATTPPTFLQWMEIRKLAGAMMTDQSAERARHYVHVQDKRIKYRKSLVLAGIGMVIRRTRRGTGILMQIG